MSCDNEDVKKRADLKISTHGNCVNEGQPTARAAIGIAFNKPAWSDRNVSEKVPQELKPHSSTLAGYFAIARALQRAPEDYNLFIESDNELAVNTLNLCLHDRETEITSKEAFAHLSNDNVIRRILQVMRWRESNKYVVKLTFAGKDPESQACLAAARRLATTALENGATLMGRKDSFETIQQLTALSVSSRGSEL